MESKTVVYTPDTGSGSGSGMMAMLAPLLQQKGIDPNLLMALIYMIISRKICGFIYKIMGLILVRKWQNLLFLK